MVWWLRILIGVAITGGVTYWYNKNVLSIINGNIEASEQYESDYDPADYERRDHDGDYDDEDEEEVIFEF